MTAESSALTARVQSGSPYQLDQSQVLRASTALLNHMEKSAAQVALASEKKDLLAHSNSSSPSPTGGEPIWLVLTTKHHITSQTRLKPGKVSLPHSLSTNPSSSICIIVPDPQRTFKDIIAHPLFPIPLGKRITKVIGISKLKARYKSFESRRQLRDEHDVFLADKRVVTMLPKSLGKVFYSSGTKRPIPIDLEGYKPKKDEGANRFSVVKKKQPEKDEGRTAAPPAHCAKEIERAMGCALVHLSPAATTSVKVGLSSFTSKQISDNVEAVVNGMIEKFVTKGWRNVKAIHVKGPNTMALPIWLAEELWIDETDVLEPEQAEQAKLSAKQRGKKQEGTRSVKAGDAMDDTSKKRKLEDTGFPQEMKERREKLKAQKKEMREAEDQLIGGEKVAKVGEPPVKKAKRRKIAAEE